MEKLPSETSTNYILRVEKIATSLRDAGETVSDGTLVAMAMKGLTESSFGPFVHLMKMNEDDDFSKFKTKLRNYEDTERCRNSSTAGEDKVLKAKFNKYQNGGRGGDRPRGGKGNTNNYGNGEISNGRKCFGCNGFGHEVKNCPTMN